VIALANICNEFAIVAKELEEGIIGNNNILPSAIDIDNFIPLLNSYAQASIEYERNKDYIKSLKKEPLYKKDLRKDFKHSGIFIKSTKDYFCVLNYKKGGTIKVFNQKTATLDMEDGGIFGILKKGTKFSTQQSDEATLFNDYSIRSGFYKINELKPTPIKFIILRALSFIFFKSIVLERLFKKFIISVFIMGKNKIDGEAIRKFEFFESKIIIRENLKIPKDTMKIGHFGKVKSMHMASSGYYLKQSIEMPKDSTLVKFGKC